MTAPFNTAGEAQLGVDRVATAPTAQLLYDNPLAIARGAPQAPRISPWAMVQPVAAGDNIRYADSYRYNLTQPQAAGDWQVMTKATLLCVGQLRATFSTIRPNSGTFRAKLVRIRGLVTTDITGDFEHGSGSSSASIGRTVTAFDVEPGDSVVLAARFSSGDPSTSSAAVDNFRLRTSGAFFWAIGGGSLVLGSTPE